ncbi:MAG: hypothetical protein N2748_01975 [candidate division WOR-3 bacterium]|nr:hypothetical protein [candidate division WOR-3 bacterium]
MDPERYLEVNTEKLRHGLNLITKFSQPKRYGGESVLSYKDGILTINNKGFTFRIEAKGKWQGSVIVPTIYLSELGKLLPSDPIIIIKTIGNQFYLGPSGFDCITYNEEIPYIELPVEPPLWMILGLKFKYNNDELEKARILNMVKKAENDLQNIIEKVAKVLRPVGINATEIEKFIYDWMKQRNTSNPE